MRTFATDPANVATDTHGEVLAGRNLTVWTERGGAQITALLAMDGVTALPGVVTTDASGRYEFKINDDTRSRVVLQAPDGSQWSVTAEEAVDGIAEAIAGVSAASADAAAAAASASAAEAASATKVDKGSLFVSMRDYALTTAGLTSAIADTATGGILDLAGLTVTLTSAVTVPKAMTIRNGALTAGASIVLILSGAPTTGKTPITLERLEITRSSSFDGTDPSLANRSSVVANARVIVRDCSFTNSGHALLYLSNGLCNGSRIYGGDWSQSLVHKNVCAIYGAAGSLMNRDIVVDGVRVDNSAGGVDGILIYNATGCRYTRCRVQHCRALPDLTWATGWTNEGGGVYSHADRTDGETNVITWNGTELTDNTGTPTAPALNQFGHTGEGALGGRVYVNVGADPSTGTLLSRTVSGYAYLFYGTTACSEAMNDNLVTECWADDIDGFALYFQLGISVAVCRRNGTANNRFTNVCLKGAQSNKLPFAAIGCIGGSDYTFSNDVIDTVGSVSFPAPGFKPAPYLPDGVNISGDMRGTVTGMSVTAASRAGILLHHGQWTLNGCTVVGSVASTNGFWCLPTANACILDATFNGCRGINNGGSGFTAEKSGLTGASHRVKIVGGLYTGNSSRGIVIVDSNGCALVKPTVHSNTVAQQVYISGTSDRCYVSVSIPVMASGQVGILFASTVGSDNVLGPCEIASGGTAALQFTKALRTSSVGATMASDWICAGTPEGQITATIGSRAMRTDGGAGTSSYVKESGTGNTGWIAK